MSQEFGLSEQDLKQIIEAAAALPEIRQLILFGSRAKGKFKPGSDVDLVIKCEEHGYEMALALSEELNENLPLPYFFDVLNFQDIDNTELLGHIERVGVTLFERT